MKEEKVLTNSAKDVFSGPKYLLFLYKPQGAMMVRVAAITTD